MNDVKKIEVCVSKPYDVLVGGGILSSAGEYIKNIAKTDRVAVITDSTVDLFYFEKLGESLSASGIKYEKFVFPSGEKSKNINTLSDILEFLAEKGIRRNDTLIALGGGVPGDIAGLAASLYMRGISVVQIATTLLSAVDSSIGGKTAIDLKNGKNMAGAFWQPSLVLIDTDIIRELPDDIFAEGMAEVIKSGVIGGFEVNGCVFNGTVENELERIITDCLKMKASVVAEDEFDLTGKRNVLNLGHTVAHGIEKLSSYTVSHGRAVGTGLVAEARIAAKLGICDDSFADELMRALNAYGLYSSYPYTAEELVSAMKSDKKNRDDRIVFVLPKKPGALTQLKLSREELLPLTKSVFANRAE